MELRLISIVSNGYGDIQAMAITLIYSALLERHNLTLYDFILINQIGDNLDELIIIDKRSVHINIQYPADEDFYLKKEDERNLIRLDLIHMALSRLAEIDQRIEISELEKIKNTIIQNNFLFDFECRQWLNKKDRKMIVKLLLNPKEERFDFFIIILENDKEVCKKMIHSTKPSTHQNFSNFFYHGKWINGNEFLLSGKLKEVEFKIYIDKCKIEYINLTNYTAPPRFDSSRPYISPALPNNNKEKEYEEWFYSLPSEWTDYFIRIAAEIAN